MVDILYPLFCVFSLFQFLWHIFFFPCNSIIYLLCRTIISFRDCCKIYIWIFNFDFSAAAYFSPEQALCCLLSGILVTRWLWCFSLKQFLKIILFFFDHSLIFHNYILFVLQLFGLLKNHLTLCNSFLRYLLTDFWSDSKRESSSWSWATRTDSLPYDLPVFILKLSECKKVEFFAAFLANLANFKYFCSTWMVMPTFYDFSLSLLELFYKALSFPLSISRSSPISL